LYYNPICVCQVEICIICSNVTGLQFGFQVYASILITYFYNDECNELSTSNTAETQTYNLRCRFRVKSSALKQSALLGRINPVPLNCFPPDLVVSIIRLKQLSCPPDDSLKIKNEKILKLTVNTCQVMFSGEIYYYWPLNSVDKSLVTYRFSLHNLLRY